VAKQLHDRTAGSRGRSGQGGKAGMGPMEQKKELKPDSQCEEKKGQEYGPDGAEKRIKAG